MNVRIFWVQGENPLCLKNFPQRRIEPTTPHQAGQRAQHTTNELFWPLSSVQIVSKCRVQWSYQIMNLWKQSCLTWILIRQNKISLGLIRPIRLSSTSNFIQTDWELLETAGADMLAFSHPCHLESRSGSFTLVSKCGVQKIYHHTKFEPNQPVKHQLFP